MSELFPAPASLPTTAELVHVPTVDRCPRCGATICERTVRQPAVMLACGYGATERTVTRSCPACPWWTTVEVSDERPER